MIEPPTSRPWGEAAREGVGTHAQQGQAAPHCTGRPAPYYKEMRNSLDIDARPQDTRVVVAMSGGVDSSVTAALLKAEGYDVVGVTLQLYDHGAAIQKKGACCAGQDIHDARDVASRIGIPHYVLDYEGRFKEAVIDRFAESYVAGKELTCAVRSRSWNLITWLQSMQGTGVSPAT